MKTLERDIVTCFDVDDTLIDYNKTGISNIDVERDGHIISVSPIESNIKQLIRHKKQGQIIIVWSRAGYRWSESVVKALKLEDYVDYAMAKPAWYYDDIDISIWLGKPRFGEDSR